MTEQAANFDPANKNESTRHLSMELIADGARVTALTLDGSRLLVTIEAELSTSQLKTSGGALGLTGPAAAPDFKPGSSDQGPLFSAPTAPRNHPKSDQANVDFPSAPTKSEYDSGLLAIRKKNAGPITFEPDDSAEGLKSAEMNADRVGLVQGLISEATEPEIESSEPQPVQPTPIAPRPATETGFTQPAGRWDDSEAIETVRGRETRISSRQKPIPPPEAKPAEPHYGDAKPLSFEFAMEAADKGKSEDNPKTEAHAKHEAKTISFGPIDPAGQGGALRDDRGEKIILFEASEPASPPPQPIPLAPAIDNAPSLQDAKPGLAPAHNEEPITLADFSATSFLETTPEGKMIPPTIVPGPPLVEDDSRWPGEHTLSEDSQPLPEREKSPLLETVAPGQLISPVTAPNMEMGDDSGEPSTPASTFEAPPLKTESKRESARHSLPAAHIGFASAPTSDAPAQSEDSNVLGGERHGEPKPTISFGFEESEPAERPEAKRAAPPAAAPKEKESGKGTAKPEAGSTTVLIRYTCPRCKTQGMQAVDKVGTVVNCSNCGKAMRLVMKK